MSIVALGSAATPSLPVTSATAASAALRASGVSSKRTRIAA